MRNIIIKLWRGHLGRSVLVACGLFCLAMVATDDRLLIDISNSVALAISAGVIVTYAPSAWVSLTREQVDKSDILIAGIMLSWVGTFYSRVVNVAVRNFGFRNLGNIDLVSGYIGILILAGVLHLNAPTVIDDRVPSEQWRRLGWMTFGAMLFAMVLLHLRG